MPTPKLWKLAHPDKPLPEKPEAIKRLDAFIAYQRGQLDETLRKLPDDPTIATQTVVGAAYHLDLIEKAEALKRVFSKLPEG